MKTLKTANGFAAYKNKQYRNAIEIYKYLSKNVSHSAYSFNITKVLHAIAKTNVSKRKNTQLQKVKVACIMDDFTLQSYKYECILFQLTPENIVQELEDFAPDLLFVESAWRGKDELWDRKISTISPELKAGLEWCNTHLVPTLFWNKEDPVHFSTFINTARLFDFVFTTDIDRISHYKSFLSHDNVFLLPFACQPKLHNPIECYNRKDAFCFAGSYYVRYPERIHDLESYIEELPNIKDFDIFDRNFGKDNPLYQFPEKFAPYIVGTLPFEEIDKAYKGYKYSINLNSIKHSQTMFARRVYELLASNTTIISNYSRGLKILFGDLTFVSDSGKQIRTKIETLEEINRKKIALAGLRKVMTEHTYYDRFRYIAEKVLLWPKESKFPSVVILARCHDAIQAKWILSCYEQQNYVNKRLIIVVPLTEHAHIDIANYSSATLISLEEANTTKLRTVILINEWAGIFYADDYYGPNYILDLALAAQYADTPAIDKEEYYSLEASEDLVLQNADNTFKMHTGICLTRGIVRAEQLVVSISLTGMLDSASHICNTVPCLSIDAFNYCKGCAKSSASKYQSQVNDLPLETGLSIAQLFDAATKISPEEFVHENENKLQKWDDSRLFECFKKVRQNSITVQKNDTGLCITSTLDTYQHEYIYAPAFFEIRKLPIATDIFTFLDSSHDFSLNYIFIFYDVHKNRISHNILLACVNNTTIIPDGAEYVRLGLRILGPGKAIIKQLLWEHRVFKIDTFFGKSDILLVTNNYPEYKNIYKNGFVHSRVKAYKQKNIPIDVFRLHPKNLEFHEYEDVEVVTGNVDILRNILLTRQHKTLLVHVLTDELWAVLKDFPDVKIFVWVHGAEIKHWRRRAFNYTTDVERNKAIKASDRRIAFWSELLRYPPENLHIIFVSQYLADIVMEDLGFLLPRTLYSIIHNPINTQFFAFEKKNSELRKQILSIRPFSSRKYGNDITVETILILSKKEFFSDLHFSIFGDGPLFDATVAPLADFANVTVHKGFLSHQEIAMQHKMHGIFLCPTRSDTQGVSRDEAMSSGLVAITNAVAAIPEFCDATCTMLAPNEDAQAMAEYIEKLFYDPELFERLSYMGSQRVRRQTDEELIIALEVKLFTGKN